jgi:hypothetical protein
MAARSEAKAQAVGFLGFKESPPKGWGTSPLTPHDLQTRLFEHSRIFVWLSVTQHADQQEKYFNYSTVPSGMCPVIWNDSSCIRTHSVTDFLEEAHRYWSEFWGSKQGKPPRN